MKSAEQLARDLLEGYGIEDAQSWSAGDLVELANLISDAHAYNQLGRPQIPNSKHAGKIQDKLSYLRDDTVDALRVYIGLLTVRFGHQRHQRADEQVRIAGMGYVTAQAKYTMALVEAQQGSILDYVELP